MGSFPKIMREELPIEAHKVLFAPHSASYYR